MRLLLHHLFHIFFFYNMHLIFKSEQNITLIKDKLMIS